MTKRGLDEELKQEAKRVMSISEFFKRKASGVDVKKRPVGGESSTPHHVKSELETPKSVVKIVKPEVSVTMESKIKSEDKITSVARKGSSPNKTLEGKTIVFTGNMSIERDKAVDLAVAAGAKVTSAVSGKTSYLVVGSVLEDGRAVEEGSKYRKMKQLESEGKSGPLMLTEDQFLELVGRSPTTRSVESAQPIAAVAKTTSVQIPPLWVDKYEPQSLDDYVGNTSTVKKVIEWLSRWKKGSSKPSGGYKPSNYPGRGGNTEAKAILLSGPPGIGKTLLARLACKKTGFEAVEFNASDYRSKSAVELIAATLSGASFTFAYSSSEKHPKGQIGLAHQCLVMDEVDGMSAGDRGGNQALMQLIKNSSIPVICICNDRMSPKVRSLANHCYDLKMTRPSRAEVIARAKQILIAEQMSAVPLAVVEQIVDGSDCDIRQVINQLEGDSFDWKSTISSYERKDKSTMLSAFDACRLIIAPKPDMSLNDRLDMFFVDYDLIPLMIQHNYVKCFQPREIEKIPKSAKLISFGDVISRTIRAEQHWSLLPEFGLIGNVFVPPKMDSGYSPYPEFPAWLGKYSTSRKSARIAQELECVVSSASTVTARNIIKSNYAHILYGHVVKELVHAATAAEVSLPTLDRFGVRKSDLMELLTELLLPWQEDIFAERVDSKTKAAITRICNAHHSALKSGGAHFRHLKSAGGGGGLSLAVADERAEPVSSGAVSEDDEEKESKATKKEAEALVKVASAKRAAKKAKTKKS